ncbi:MAG: sulfatase-like hydrolase/transferase [Planctomycetota bacterium]
MLTLLFTLQAALPAAPQDPLDRPNVLLIVSDDQGYGDFGFMGSAEVRTPHLDQLAREGLVFPHGYVPTALCRPSLATLITGLYPHQHKITGNDPPAGVDRARMLAHIEAVDTVPKLLLPLGYRSLQTGKWWEGNCLCGGFTEGMTHGDPARGGRHGDVGLEIGRKTLQPALDFVDACIADEAPFFLWYAPFLPHEPHTPPARLLEAYATPEVPTPIAKYRAMCTWFDETCGALLAHLDARGIADDTLVVLVVDNGWIQRPGGAGFAPRSKRSAYEGGVRTPIVLRWPGRIAPQRCDIPVSSVDLPATILAACGVAIPAAWPGVDLRGDLSQRGPVFGAAFTHDVVELDQPVKSMLSRWVLRDPFKLIVSADPGAPCELYNVRADPAEESPLDDQDTVRALRAELDRWWPGANLGQQNQR